MRILEIIMDCIAKAILSLTLVIVIAYICLIVFLYISSWWFPEFCGSYNLGNNIYMLDCDGGGRIIVSGSSFDGNTCIGGAQLIPTYENHLDSLGNFAEIVIEAEADENWIIAKTENKRNLQRKYYILDKRNITDKVDSEVIIKTRIRSFADSIEFAEQCHNSKIRLQWSSEK